LDDLDLDEGDDPCPSPFERITVAPEVPESEYVARMMREAPPSDPVPAARSRASSPARSDERISGLVPAPAKTESSRPVSSWPVAPWEEPPPLYPAASVPPPPATSSSEPLVTTSDAPDATIPSIPPPPSLPGETPTGVRERAAVARDSDNIDLFF